MRNGPLFASRLSQLTVSQVIHYRHPWMHLVLDLLILLLILSVSLDWAAYPSSESWCGVMVEVVVVCSASRPVLPMPAFADCWMTFKWDAREGCVTETDSRMGCLI